jgi:hypothetical protein
MLVFEKVWDFGCLEAAVGDGQQRVVIAPWRAPANPAV